MCWLSAINLFHAFACAFFFTWFYAFQFSVRAVNCFWANVCCVCMDFCHAITVVFSVEMDFFSLLLVYFSTLIYIHRSRSHIFRSRPFYLLLFGMCACVTKWRCKILRAYPINKRKCHFRCSLEWNWFDRRAFLSPFPLSLSLSPLSVSHSLSISISVSLFLSLFLSSFLWI